MISIQSLAGTTELFLPAQTPAFQKQLDELYEAGRLSELVDPRSFTASLSEWAVPPIPAMPRPEIGMLYWPVIGMARYAFGTFLIDGFTLERLYADALDAGFNKVTLRLYDSPDASPPETPRAFALELLQVRPIARQELIARPALSTEPTTDELYVITLVDARYRALLAVATTFGDPASWTAIFGAADLVPTITVTDAPDSDYLVPDETRWTEANCAGQSRAWLLDIAAASIGSRIVTSATGSSFLQRPTLTNRNVAVNFHLAWVADDRLVAGGHLELKDNLLAKPGTVKVLFADDPVVTVTVTSGGDSLRSVSAWADAKADIGSSPRSALAAQWSDDFVAWQDAVLDATYDGFVAVPVSGFVDSVLYRHTATTGRTWVYRPGADWGVLPRPAGSGGGDLTVEEVDGTPSVTGVRRLLFDQADGLKVTEVEPGVARIDFSGGGSSKPIPCGWLEGVQESSCWSVYLRGGKGACGCFDEDDIDDAEAGGVAKFMPDLDGWLVAKWKTGPWPMVNTCCGCGSLLLKIDDTTFVPTLKLGGVHGSCGNEEGGVYGAVYTKTLTEYICYELEDGRRVVEFYGYDVANACDGDLVPCVNEYSIAFVCGADCPPTECACDACNSVEPPIAWYAFALSGFDDPRWDGDWIWKQTASCGWVATCKENTSYFTVVGVSSTVKTWRLTHGGAVFDATVGISDCGSDLTLTKTSGTGPSTVVLKPVAGVGSGENCCDPADVLYATSAYFGTTIALTRSLVLPNVWSDTGFTSCGGPPATFGPQFLEKKTDGACLWDMSPHASCCGPLSNNYAYPISNDPFVMIITGPDYGGFVAGCPSSDTWTITDVAP